MKETTIKLDADRRQALKDAAFDISMVLRETVAMSEIVKHLIDNHLKEAVGEMKKLGKNHGISG